jgi:effector-binding domain-containing protein
MEIDLKKTEEQQVSYIFYTGPVEDMGELIGEIVDWMMAQNVEMSGPPYSAYYTSPAEVAPEDMQYEMGVPFTGDAIESGKVKIKNLPAQNVLSAIHKGPYQEVGQVYEVLMSRVIGEGYQMIGAPMEIYFNSPMEVPESELLTEIQFPVVKM